MDVVKLALILCVCGILLATAAALVVASYNSGSRNLALATGTLAAAAVLFLVQLWFELQPSKIMDHVTTEFTVDAMTPFIRKWNYTAVPSWRIAAETGASSWLVTNNPVAFGQDRDRLFSDFSIFSLVSFLAAQEFDWQLQRVESAQTTFGTISSSQSVSKDSECASFNEQALRVRLSGAKNLFSGAHLTVSSGRLCLPPKSTLDITAREVTIRNRICQISWKLDTLPFLTSFVEPGSSGEVPKLDSGQPRYESRVGGFNMEVTYFALRSQNRESSKYKAWVSRVLSDGQKWFEGTP